jgi:hypothetical protein
VCHDYQFTERKDNQVSVMQVDLPNELQILLDKQAAWYGITPEYYLQVLVVDALARTTQSVKISIGDKTICPCNLEERQ